MNKTTALLPSAASAPALLAVGFRNCTRKRSTFRKTKKAAIGGGLSGKS